jgi:phage gp46-like protein
MQDFQISVDSSGHLYTDDSLRTMVLVALYTWRRGDPEDDVPDVSDLKGWWGDSYPEVEGDQMGSKLWQLQGMNAGPTAIEFAKQEIAAALQFMLDDGIVDNVLAEIEISGTTLAGRIGLLRPRDPNVLWVPLWDATLAIG